MSAVDRFLSLHFRTSERRASPPSIAGRDHASTHEQAEHAEAGYIWTLTIMGALERSGALTVTAGLVLREFYLCLSPAHVSLVERRFPGAHVRVVRAVDMGARGTPDAAADLQSYCDWSRLARACGVVGRRPATEARRIFAEARHAVSAELVRRGVDGVEESEPGAETDFPRPGQSAGS